MNENKQDPLFNAIYNNFTNLGNQNLISNLLSYMEKFKSLNDKPNLHTLDHKYTDAIFNKLSESFETIPGEMGIVYNVNEYLMKRDNFIDTN